MSASSGEWRAVIDTKKPARGVPRMALVVCGEGGRNCADFTGSGANFAQDAANARLAAAAPALLAAAQAILNGGFKREDTEYADGLFACLEQAIAKATGAP